jgi:hypothetical protein
MKRFFIALFPILLISLFSTTVVAQYTNEPPPYGDFKATKFPDDNFRDSSGTSRSFPLLLPEDRVMKHGPFALSVTDRTAAKAFLKRPHTGLVRLLPREVYDSETYRTNRRFTVRGSGAYYSFAKLIHHYGYGSDIELDHNKLSVGFAGADFGMMTNLGDTALEEITLNDPRVQYLLTYSPPRKEPQAREEYRRFSSPAGVLIDGALYHRSLPVQENATYLLRSIVYDRTDVLVAFRVVRKEPDDSVTIAWKLLKRFSASKLN